MALPVTLLLLFGCYAAGQEITATISGRVTDPSGAAVPGATITVVSTDRAVVPLLSIGYYDVTAEAPGFNRSSQTGIEMSVNDRRTINLVLRVRGQSEEIKALCFAIRGCLRDEPDCQRCPGRALTTRRQGPETALRQATDEVLDESSA
jgi:hypothetical protein